MHKITEREKTIGLLEPERARDFSRSNRFAETANISELLLEETADVEATRPVQRDRRRGGRESRLPSRFSWKHRWVRVAAVFIVLAGLGLVAAVLWGMKSVMLHNPRFLLKSRADIQVSGNRVVPAGDVLRFFVPDLGLSILRVPLSKRRAEVQKIPWVRRATVMRMWPNRLGVRIVERSPVAFSRDGDTIRLVDGEGVLLDLPEGADQHYSFPVLTGVSSAQPLAARAARIQTYRRFTQALDADGDKVSAALSEVDLSDPEDVRAVFTGGTHPPVVHFGSANFLPRYRAYRAHLADWMRQYPGLRSVDMRYGRQVVLDTGAQPGFAASAPRETPVGGTAAAKNAGSDAAPPKKPSAAKHARTASPRHKAPKSSVRVHRHAKAHAHKRGRGVRHPVTHAVNGI